MKKIIIALVLVLALMITMIACTTSGGDDKKEDENNNEENKVTTTTRAGSDIPPAGGDDDDDDDDDDDEMVDIFFKHGSAVIDGERDLSWDDAQTVELELIKTGNRTDAVVKASTMWDETGLYFLFEIEDETLSFESTAGDWHNDSLYLYICEDMEFGDTISTSGEYSNGAFQFALINPELELLPRNGDAVETKSAYKTTDTGMVIEFWYQPLDYMIEDTLQAGHLMYLDYQYNDCNAPATRDCAFSYYCAQDGQFAPSNFAYAKLLAEGEAIPAAD